MSRRQNDPCPVDMTPMIDVVFQLIIFFIVTINMEQSYQKDIELEDAKNGEEITEDNTDESTMTVEIDKSGRIFMSGALLSRKQLRWIIKNRYNRMGEFPLYIRADRRTRHSKVRKVMDVCTESGIWKIDFVAKKEDKTPDNN